MVKKIRTTCIIRELRNCGQWQENTVYRPVKHNGRLLGVFLTHRPKMGVSDYRYTLDLSNFLKLGRNVGKKILDLFIVFLIHLCPVVEFGTKTSNFQNDAKNFKTVFYDQYNALTKILLKSDKTVQNLKISNFPSNDHIWSKFRGI